MFASSYPGNHLWGKRRHAAGEATWLTREYLARTTVINSINGRLSRRCYSPVAIHLVAVLFETPHAFAAARMLPPGTSMTAGCFLGRPSRRPCLLARCNPATLQGRR